MNEIFEVLQLKTDISVYNINFIRNLIEHRMMDLSINEVAEYGAYIAGDAVELDVLTAMLKNSFSQFFRNRLTFEVLGQVVLPSLIIKNTDTSEVRVWSVACAGGHEPYSLAIVFEKFNKASAVKFKYRIFATDRDYHEIERAVVGIFSSSDIGNLSNLETAHWFEPIGKNYKIKAELKKNIQFELFDLLQNSSLCPRSSIFGSFDFIMCANVLIYYNEKTQRQIVSNLKKCISTNGYIISGETERDVFLSANFKEVFPQSCIFKL